MSLSLVYFKYLLPVVKKNKSYTIFGRVPQFEGESNLKFKNFGSIILSFEPKKDSSTLKTSKFSLQFMNSFLVYRSLRLIPIQVCKGFKYPVKGKFGYNKITFSKVLNSFFLRKFIVSKKALNIANNSFIDSKSFTKLSLYSIKPDNFIHPFLSNYTFRILRKYRNKYSLYFSKDLIRMWFVFFRGLELINSYNLFLSTNLLSQFHIFKSFFIFRQYLFLSSFSKRVNAAKRFRFGLYSVKSPINFSTNYSDSFISRFPFKRFVRFSFILSNILPKVSSNNFKYVNSSSSIISHTNLTNNISFSKVSAKKYLLGNKVSFMNKSMNSVSTKLRERDKSLKGYVFKNLYFFNINSNKLPGFIQNQESDYFFNSPVDSLYDDTYPLNLNKQLSSQKDFRFRKIKEPSLSLSFDFGVSYILETRKKRVSLFRHKFIKRLELISVLKNLEFRPKARKLRIRKRKRKKHLHLKALTNRRYMYRRFNLRCFKTKKYNKGFRFSMRRRYQFARISFLGTFTYYYRYKLFYNTFNKFIRTVQKSNFLKFFILRNKQFKKYFLYELKNRHYIVYFMYIILYLHIKKNSLSFDKKNMQLLTILRVLLKLC